MFAMSVFAVCMSSDLLMCWGSISAEPNTSVTKSISPITPRRMSEGLDLHTGQAALFFVHAEQK
jgi:hypothetical protein